MNNNYYFIGIRYNNFNESEYKQRKDNKKEFPNKKLCCVWFRNKYGVWTSCHIWAKKDGVK